MRYHQQIISICLLLTSLNLIADESESCVDLADDDDLVAFHNCEQSGRLDKVFKGLFSSSDKPEKQEKTKPSQNEKPEKPAKKEAQLLTTQISTSIDEPSEALICMLSQCPEGFEVLRDTYMPSENGSLTLTQNFRCL